MNTFQSLREYERFVYTLQQQYASIQRATLVVAQRGRLFADLSGELVFHGDLRLSIYERLSLDEGTVMIEGYSYEAWQSNEKLYWYDSQSHPHDATLASTDPHHKHIPPDIKHHRIPAPNLRFNGPNLPALIDEVEGLLPAV